MRAFPLAAAALLMAVLLSGCTTAPAPAEQGQPQAGASVGVPGFSTLPAALAPLFSKPVLLDTVRAGGEPVIAVTHKGTILVSAHPGFTHYHPTDPTHVPAEVVEDFGGQSYLWRSTDNGTTWQPIGLPLPANGMGPRSAGFGVSDPEFTVMDDGAICYTDLENLVLSSVSCSTDDGVSWLPGNAAASGGPNDRQWLASHGDRLYFTANYFADHHVRVSLDKGLTWKDLGDVPCSGDIVANPMNGHLYAGCGHGIAVSTDGGVTWSQRRELANHTGGHMTEPAVDAAGNVWMAWEDGERTLWAAGTPDEGLTWPWVIDLTPHARLASTDAPRCAPTTGTELTCDAPGSHPQHAPTNGTFVWPWISAGSAGRFAVTWIGSYAESPSEEQNGPWYVFTAFVLDATGAAPSVTVSRLTPDPIHVSPICQQGTACQVSSVQGAPSGDRRLGDFFETTVEPGTGDLLGVWSNTYAQRDDVISHPQFVRQVGGARLLTDADLHAYRPTQG
jgi:hypothetical protein